MNESNKIRYSTNNNDRKNRIIYNNNKKKKKTRTDVSWNYDPNCNKHNIITIITANIK